MLADACRCLQMLADACRCLLANAGRCLQMLANAEFLENAERYLKMTRNT
jgi:hypothetical protein